MPSAPRRGHQPRVLAPRPRRREHTLVAELISGPGDLGEVVDRRSPPVAIGPERNDGAAVDGGGQEPVQLDGHRRSERWGYFRLTRSSMRGDEAQVQPDYRNSRLKRSYFAVALVSAGGDLEAEDAGGVEAEDLGPGLVGEMTHHPLDGIGRVRPRALVVRVVVGPQQVVDE